MFFELPSGTTAVPKGFVGGCTLTSHSTFCCRTSEMVTGIMLEC